MVVESWPQFWAVSICFFHLVWCVSKHVHAFHEQGLGSTALLSVPLLFKPANDLDFMVSDLKKMASNIWFQLLDLCLCNFPSFPLSALRRCMTNLMALSYSLSYIRVFPLVYSLFSLRIVPHEPVFLMHGWSKVNSLSCSVISFLNFCLFI